MTQGGTQNLQREHNSLTPTVTRFPSGRQIVVHGSGGQR
jgi:hypothetical protein